MTGGITLPRRGPRLGPARLHGSTLVLRPPRYADFPQWQRLRLRDRAVLEPFWHTSALDWDARHNEKAWVRECLEAATTARTGRRFATVIEIDGRFAGQVEIGNIDAQARQGEMGIWIDARTARHGFGGIAAGLILDFAFDRLGLERVIAPISPGNAAATNGAKQIGFVREGRMSLHFHVGGARADHDLWAMTRVEMPATGFTRMWIERSLAHASAPQPHRDAAIASDRTPSAATIAGVLARYRAGQLWRAGRQLVPARPVTLRLPGEPRAVLRSLRPADLAGSTARNGVPGLGDVLGSTGPARWREFARGAAGVRSPAGLLLVLDVEGRDAGYARLFDLDMFDRNARMQLRADPALADDGVRLAATRALLAYAFGTLGLFRVFTAIPAGDTASAAVAARAGLHKEATMRSYTGIDGRHGDHELWAVTAGGDRNA
ncbi:GNAT family N-acetyltransferase [Nocardia yunnanensis]|uniref:GNAT family N-acetyltransferase n=1 Tax=Nocardia yunnanensis TaxID=2382165 RepID=UPI0013C4B307|nr:GNAT family protein [Nocardia yunnanensis]